MRFRTHLLTSALTGFALYPRAPRRAALFFVGGVLLDLDHYLVYALRSGDWNPVGALRYDRRRGIPVRPGDTKPRYGSLRSILHRPALTLTLTWLLSLRWRMLRPLAAGLTLHLLMDAPLLLRLDWRVWRRAAGHCERCGVAGLALDIHYVRFPKCGGSRWSLDNRAAWCADCAREARKLKP